VADLHCVWSVRVPSGWARKHIDDVRPMSLSVTEARLLVTFRSGRRLTLFAADAKLLRQVGVTYQGQCKVKRLTKLSHKW